MSDKRKAATINFEADIGEVLYDCDADVSFVGDKPVVELLEVRVVNDDGEGFVVAQIEKLPAGLKAELVLRAEAENQVQIETWHEKQAEGDR